MGDAPNIVDTYRILNRSTIPAYLADIPAAIEVLKSVDDLIIEEIGDGNLNYVFKVTSSLEPKASVIVKQAVPFLRMVGEDWPLGRDRMKYEIRALTVYNDLVPNLVPKIFHADEAMSTLVMQYLDSHIILRSGMIAGIEYPNLSQHIGLFMAETLFKTSAWSMDSLQRRELMSKFTMNSELCKLTEDFIFTFPYFEHDSNYSNPKTDTWVSANIHSDYEYKRDVLLFKELFVSKSEALLHGDLHSGSLMVNQEESYIIDMEFAFFGPISFDVGKIISNFLLCCTAHYYLPGGSSYRDWILRQIPSLWENFESNFLELWNKTDNSAMLSEGYFSQEEISNFQSDFMLNILREAIGFAACSMARRTIGIAGVADIRDIENLETRSRLEITNLKLSKVLMSQHNSVTGVDDLLKIIGDFYSDQKV